MPVLYCVGFAVLWYFLGFWLALCAAAALVLLARKPDWFFMAVGSVMLILLVAEFVSVFF
ncbi:MAG: hypothetical protein OXQ29_17125 [Rhodospirillaceae bacterium]|nr:hypothetical protein [Rhodospirillaceae bacterium]